MINLVGNAIKFSDDGRPVTVTAALGNDHAVIRVTDRGPGIPAESLPKLFDKLYQTSDAGKRAATGTGLGLYISKQIIEAHGGRAEVESEVGFGSSFSLVLPLAVPTRDDELRAAGNRTE